MTKKEIKEIFPARVKVTKNMIKRGREYAYSNSNLCIGALALRHVLNRNKVRGSSFYWLFSAGYITGSMGRTWKDGVTIHSSRDMTKITKPTFVTLSSKTDYDKETN